MTNCLWSPNNICHHWEHEFLVLQLFHWTSLGESELSSVWDHRVWPRVTCHSCSMTSDPRSQLPEAGWHSGVSDVSPYPETRTGMVTRTGKMEETEMILTSPWSSFFSHRMTFYILHLENNIVNIQVRKKLLLSIQLFNNYTILSTRC